MTRTNKNTWTIRDSKSDPVCVNYDSSFKSRRFVLYSGVRPLGRFSSLTEATDEARSRGLT